MITVHHVKRLTEGWKGLVRLYALSEPVEFDSLSVEYVVISAVVAQDSNEPETYIFPADTEGNVLSWLEMPGSFKGGLNHEKAIEEAGWKLEHKTQ